MLTNPFEIEKYLRLVAKRANLAVRFEDKIIPRADRNTIYLPKPTILTKAEQALNLKRWMVHEVNHHNFSDLDQKIAPGLTADRSFLGALWNVCEDDRIDHLGAREYAGDAEVIGGTWGPAVEAQIEKYTKPGAADPEMMDKALPLMAFAAARREDEFPASSGARVAAEAAMSPKARAYYDKLMKGGYADALKNAALIEDKKRGTAETLKIAERIYQEVFEQDPEAEKERCKQEHESDAGSGEGEGEKQDKAGGKSGEVKKEVSKDPIERSKHATVKWSDITPGEVHNVPKSTFSAGMSIDYKDYVEGTPWNANTFDKYKTADYTKNEIHPDLRTNESYIRHYIEEFERHDHMVSPGFANLVRAKLQIRARAKTQYGMKRGKIASRSLYRTALKDAPDLQEKIFKQTVKTNVLDVAVGILVDASGSMSGEKFVHATISASLLNEALGNVLHIPIEITAFSDDSDATHMHIVRDYNTQQLGKDVLFNRMGRVAQLMHSNADGEAVLWMWDRLVKRKEKRKVLVVLSDGSPAASRYAGDIVKYTSQVTDMIQKDRRVDLVGVGIMDRNVERFYKERYTINSAEQLETALLTLIDRKII